MKRVTLALLFALALSTLPAATARADIYQWAGPMNTPYAYALLCVPCN